MPAGHDEGPDGPTETIAVTLTGRRSDLQRLCDLLDELALRHGLSEGVLADLTVALEEIVLNVINHGAPATDEKSIVVRLSVGPAAVVMEVEDNCQPFNPLERAAPDLSLPIEKRPIGGLGIHLVRNLMDKVEYRRQNDRNLFVMTKRRTAP